MWGFHTVKWNNKLLLPRPRHTKSPAWVLVAVSILFIFIWAYSFFSHTINNTPRVLCYIPLHETRIRVAKTIAQTWGKGCDKLLFFGDFWSGEGTSDDVQVTRINASEDYTKLWGKTKAMLVHLNHHYAEVRSHLDMELCKLNSCTSL